MKLADAAHRPELYPDRHLNVFVPYRAHELDYNVLRALITTLRWSRPELTQEFLAEVVGLDGDTQGPFQFDLQACDWEDFDPAAVSRQVVLGISRKGRIATRLPSLDDGARSAMLLGMLRAPADDALKLAEVRRFLNQPELDADDLAVLHHTLEELEDGCLPDGWILSPEDGLCVLVEAKLTELLDLTQMQRYADVYFGREYSAEDLVLVTWEQVAAFFAARRAHEDPQTAFLCGQLHDYLDLLALAAFTGFRPYDLDPDAAREALPKFQRFAGALQAKAQEEGLPLAEVRSSPTGARIAFSDPHLPGELRLDLLEAGIRIEHRAGDGAEGSLPGRSSVDAILAHGQDGETNPLAEAELAGLRVRVERLQSTTPEGELYVARQTLEQPLVTNEFDFVLSELRRQHPAEVTKDLAGYFRHGGLSIGRTIPRSQALGAADALFAAALGLCRTLVGVARQLVAEPAPAS